MALILSLSVRQMLAVFSGVEFYFRKRKQTRCLVFTFSTKREIRHFHVVVVQWRQRNVRDARAELLFCRSEPLTIFCRSRWRRRRLCLSSVIFVCVPLCISICPPFFANSCWYTLLQALEVLGLEKHECKCIIITVTFFPQPTLPKPQVMIHGTKTSWLFRLRL